MRARLRAIIRTYLEPHVGSVMAAPSQSIHWGIGLRESIPTINLLLFHSSCFLFFIFTFSVKYKQAQFFSIRNWWFLSSQGLELESGECFLCNVTGQKDWEELPPSSEWVLPLFPRGLWDFGMWVRCWCCLSLGKFCFCESWLPNSIVCLSEA